MPRSRKINLEKVRVSLDKVCPKCGKSIPPAEVRRVDFERIECPVCGEQFVASPVRGWSRSERACKNGPTLAEKKVGPSFLGSDEVFPWAPYTRRTRQAILLFK
jgi:ribosomal protein S27AE